MDRRPQLLQEWRHHFNNSHHIPAALFPVSAVSAVKNQTAIGLLGIKPVSRALSTSNPVCFPLQWKKSNSFHFPVLVEIINPFSHRVVFQVHFVVQLSHLLSPFEFIDLVLQLAIYFILICSLRVPFINILVP